VSGRRAVGFRLAVVVALALAAAMRPGYRAEAQRGPVLKVAVDEPRGWDPHVDLDAASASHWEQIYESLVQFGPRLEVEPALAEAWEQPDARTYVFRLRHGVLFHHGREMQGGDVKYSFERARALRPTASDGPLAGIGSVETLDPYSVKVTLSRPDAGFLSRLASNRGSAVVPRDIVERRGDLKAVMVGTGPFRIKKTVPGAYAELERNPRYWAKELPRADGLLLLVVKDEGARLAELRRGAVDVASVRDPATADLATGEPSVHLATPPPARQLALWLQEERLPFKVKKLRQGLSAAFDRALLVKTVLRGHGEVTSALPPAAMPYAVPKEEVTRLPFYIRDIPLSRRLLAEAGHSNGFELTMIVAADSPDLVSTAQVLQAQLKDVGIKVVVQTTDRMGVTSRLRSGDFQALLTTMGWTPDPDAHLRPALYSTSQDNHGHYRNPVVDRLLDESRATLVATTRVQQWRRIQAIVAEDVPIVWLAATPACFELIRASITGYAPRPDCSRVNLKYAAVGR
jgi:peptide/nickel transport system substrate-binding protein